MAILGIDEVGRGPLAGPLVIGAVILPDDEPSWVYDLRDSKKLSRNRREELNTIILEYAPATGLGWVSAQEFDEYGVIEALKLATRRAVKQIQSLHVPFHEIIIDGDINFLADTPLASRTTTVIKADDRIHAVSAASIIAKVAHDHYMFDVAAKYPEYDFEHHVGYGTPKHLDAIECYGLTPEHRRSVGLCKTISGFRPRKTAHNQTTSTGKLAESHVASYIENHGHTIIARNHRTPFYEIDIISIKDNNIYFTEVKYRNSNSHGTPLDAITSKKQKQMRFAALSYLKYQNTRFKNYQPILAAASITGRLDDNNNITWFTLSE